MLSFKDFKVLWKNRFGKSAPKPDVADEDDEEKLPEKAQDKEPGKVKMVGGEHGQVYGVKRKIISGFVVVCLLVVGLALAFNMSDKKDKGKRPAQPARQEEAATAKGEGITADADDYAALFRADETARRRGAQNRTTNTNNGSTSPTADNDATNDAVTAGATVARNERQRATAPAITTPTYPTVNAPYPTTSLYPTPVTTPDETKTASANKEADKAQNELENRYRSAIAFALGNRGSNNAGNNTTETNSDGTTATPQVTAGKSNSGVQTYQYTAPGNMMLQAGSLIPAMLFTGINTDIAGQATAQVMADVYDTATRSVLLIPMGSQLIGTYEAGNSSGNGRVNLTFTTVVLPSGGSYSIDGSMVAVDGAGYNGIKGKVDHHTDRIIGKGLINSALNAISNIGVDRVTLDMRGLASSMAGDSAKETVTIEPGREFNLFVTKPIVFRQ